MKNTAHKRPSLLAVITVVICFLTTSCASTESNYRLWTVASIAATAADAATTVASLKRGAHEANPILAPVFKQSPAAGAGVMLVVNLGSIRVANKMRRNGDPRWAVPLVSSTVIHSLAAASNARNLKRPAE